MCHGYLRHPFSLEDVTTMVRHVYRERVVFHNGDGEVAPGLTLHHIGGHSDGLQAVRVATKRGPIVLASDAAHYYENIGLNKPFPIVYDVGAMLEGFVKLRALAGDPCRVIPGHDPIVRSIYPNAAPGVDVVALHEDPAREVEHQRIAADSKTARPL
jgi:glyoxylase-like metal-dependent hydrolase (beta-lactamase superfamily II)